MRTDRALGPPSGTFKSRLKAGWFLRNGSALRAGGSHRMHEALSSRKQNRG
jgi:hypothetical protein